MLKYYSVHIWSSKYWDWFISDCFGPVHTGYLIRAGDHVVLGRQVPIAVTSVLSAHEHFQRLWGCCRCCCCCTKAPRVMCYNCWWRACVSLNILWSLCIRSHPVFSEGTRCIFMSHYHHSYWKCCSESPTCREWYAAFLYKCRNSKQPDDRGEHSSVTFLVDALVKWLSIDWRY